MPNYSREGKIHEAMTEEEFNRGLETGRFNQERHRALGIFLWYTALRISEALAVTREQFKVEGSTLYVDTGIRLKKRKFTRTGKPKHLEKPDPLPLPLTAPHMDEVLKAVSETAPGQRVFPYCRATGYNIIRRAWKYPHLFRLSRITTFLNQGYRIPDVKSWTSLTAAAIEHYIGRGDLKGMGESLAINRAPTPTQTA